MKARACGKVILLGEHAVVYGKAAIAAGIDRGAWAHAGASLTAGASLSVPHWNISVRHDERDVPLGRAFGDLWTATREAQIAEGCEPVGAVAIEAGTDLPPGAGLGCSAALGVAVARALDPIAAPHAIAERAMAWERVFHGQPSGIDATVCALGGSVLFERGEGALPRIERVRVRAQLHLAVGHSGEASSTKSMVEMVARLRERRADNVAKTFDAIHTLVKNARLALEAADRRAIGQLMDLNQMLLAGLFLSTPEIEQMCALARGAGAFGAKLTGAGGGGCTIALVDGPEVGARVLEAWREAGFEGFLTAVGPEPSFSSAARVALAPESAP